MAPNEVASMFTQTPTPRRRFTPHNDWDSSKSNVNISQPGVACTLSQNITATGTISISASSVSGTGKNLNGSTVSVFADGGNITLGDINATVASGGTLHVLAS